MIQGVSGSSQSSSRVSPVIAALNVIAELQSITELRKSLVQLKSVVRARIGWREPKSFDDLEFVIRSQDWSRWITARDKFGVDRGEFYTHLAIFAQLTFMYDGDASYAFEIVRRDIEDNKQNIQEGDTLAIYIDKIFPYYEVGQAKPNIPVLQSGTNPPVIGIPVQVAGDGTVGIDMLGRVNLEGLSLDRAREKLLNSLVERRLLSETEQIKINVAVNFLQRAGEKSEVRTLAGPSVIASPSKK